MGCTMIVRGVEVSWMGGGGTAEALRGIANFDFVSTLSLLFYLGQKVEQKQL